MDDEPFDEMIWRDEIFDLEYDIKELRAGYQTLRDLLDERMRVFNAVEYASPKYQLIRVQLKIISDKLNEIMGISG